MRNSGCKKQKPRARAKLRNFDISRTPRFSEMSGSTAGRTRRTAEPAPEPLIHPHKTVSRGTRPAVQLAASGFHSTRPSGEACLLPKLLPVPYAGSCMKHAIAELVREHQNLPAMMRLVREHVSKHRCAGRPSLRPTPAREFRHATIRRGRKRVAQHAQTLHPTFFVRGRSLFDRAAIRIKRRRTLQMRRRILQPGKTNVVQMDEDRRNRPAAASFAWQLRTPSTRVQLR